MDKISALYSACVAQQRDDARLVSELKSDPNLHQKLRDFLSSAKLGNDDLILFDWMCATGFNVSISELRALS
jgi:hypothetical protein